MLFKILHWSDQRPKIVVAILLMTTIRIQIFPEQIVFPFSHSHSITFAFHRKSKSDLFVISSRIEGQFPESCSLSPKTNCASFDRIVNSMFLQHQMPLNWFLRRCRLNKHFFNLFMSNVTEIRWLEYEMKHQTKKNIKLSMMMRLLCDLFHCHRLEWQFEWKKWNESIKMMKWWEWIKWSERWNKTLSIYFTWHNPSQEWHWRWTTVRNNNYNDRDHERMSGERKRKI